MTSIFHPLTVREWDRLTSAMERAVSIAAEAIPDLDTHSYRTCQAYAGVADELTDLHGELVQTWQAAFYGEHGHESFYDPSGDPNRATGGPRAEFQCCGETWLPYPVPGRPVRCGTCLSVFTVKLFATVPAYEPSAEPGAFPVMGDPWARGSDQ
jgi:hypothetical protein